MSVEKLARVLWRLESQNKDPLRHKDLKRAIMLEIGTDPRTIKTNTQRLKELGWITTSKWHVKVTGKHLTET
jgi:hypothetical protein